MYFLARSLLWGNNTLWTSKLGLGLHADHDLKEITFNLSPQNSKTPFFTHKHGKDLLTFLLMFGVDPPLRFVRLLTLLLPKTILQSRQNTMHACYFSTWGLEIKHKSNKTHITHALGREKYSLLFSRWINLQSMLRPATVPWSWSWAPPLLCPPTSFL